MKTLIILLLLTASAFAQQPTSALQSAPEQLSASQAAVKVAEIVNQMSETIDTLIKQNAELHKQIADLQKKQKSKTDGKPNAH